MKTITSALTFTYCHSSQIYHCTKHCSFLKNYSIGHVIPEHKINPIVQYIKLSCCYLNDLEMPVNEGALAYATHVPILNLNEPTHQC